ncbi:MAG: hypothetical protein QNJ47_12760 [Nostocaceae cyanobacterium]|nr:hypothetical protein [Nostocaceae cyanobacterium]
MAKITVADLYPIDSVTFLEELSHEKTTTIVGGYLSRWQLENLDRKFDDLSYRQYSLFRKMSHNIDQKMYNEIMSWDFPNYM